MAISFCLANSFSFRLSTKSTTQVFWLQRRVMPFGLVLRISLLSSPVSRISLQLTSNDYGYSLQLRFALLSDYIVAGCWEAYSCSALLSMLLMLMCQSACFFRVARRLGLLLRWAIVSELCSKEFAVHFFISHRQVMFGIVFLLGLTTSNCLLILSPPVEELLPCRRAFRSRDCLVIIYGSITS